MNHVVQYFPGLLHALHQELQAQLTNTHILTSYEWGGRDENDALIIYTTFYLGGVRGGHSHGSACEGLEVGLCNSREKESGKNSIKTQLWT